MLNPTSLRTQITALLALPLAVVVTVAGVNLGHATTTARRHHAEVGRVEVAIAATTAARQLAQEQSLSASSQAGKDGPKRTVPDELAFQRSQTTRSVEDLAEAVEAVRSAPEGEARPALEGLRRLGAARKAVDRGGSSTDQVRGSYADIIEPVLRLGPAVEAGTDPSVASGLSALDALSRGIQEVAFERSLVGDVLVAGRIDEPTYERLLGTVASQSVWFEQFQQRAAPTQIESFRDVEVLADMGTAQGLRQRTLASGPVGPVNGDVETWTSSMDRKLDQLEALADDTATAAIARAVADDHAASGHRTIALLLVVAAVLFAAGLVLPLHQFVCVRLRRLASATSRAATQSLPEAIETAGTDGLGAGQRALAPVPTTGSPELDEIVEAFNSVQGTALGLASRSATLRDNVHAVCLNFGRRTQSLVTRQLGHIDDLEARTDDPDTLADLFLLDHLSTRLRRNAESLVVMAGAESPRPWARPVSVVNVVRAAAAEATDYSRVDLERMAAVAVVGAAANDVSHLLAELLDNALAFSPPEARVGVAGAHHPEGGYVITVADAGIGMSGRQLADANVRIAHQPSVEAEMAGYFGLFVVGRFARRNGIDVRLVPSQPTGVTAEVRLPAALLVGVPTVSTAPPPSKPAPSVAPQPAMAAAETSPPALPAPAARPTATANTKAAPPATPVATTPPPAKAPSLVPRALRTAGTVATPPAAPAAQPPTPPQVPAQAPGPALAPISATATWPGTGTANGSLTLVGAETSDWPRSGENAQQRGRAPWLRRRIRRSADAEREPTPRPDGEVAPPSSPGSGDG
jgi:signal transduction histidine kinase